MQRVGQSGAVAASSSPAAKALAIVSTMRKRVMAMPAGKRTWLLASVAFLAAMGAGLDLVCRRPDWRVLFSGLDGKDVQQVSQELAAAGIPYETTVDGAGIQVPAEMLDKAARGSGRLRVCRSPDGLVLSCSTNRIGWGASLMSG